MIWLKQSTAVVLSFGPFVDKTDGVTPETGLVSALDHASTGVMLSKNGGAFAVRHASVTASAYDAYGNYRVTLDTTDTNTLGAIRVQFIETATCLPVWADCMVVPANVWDSMFGSSLLQVDVTKWLTGTIPAVNVTGVPLVDAKYLLGTVFSTPTVAGVPNVNAKTWNDIATVALPLIPTTAGRTLDVSAGGEAGVDWANVGAPTTAVDLSGTTIKTSQVIASVSGAVGSVTGNVGGNVTGSVGSVVGAVGSVTGMTASDVGAIKAKTDNLPSDPADESLIIAATDAITSAIAALNNLSQANVRTAVGLASANLDTQLDALPTNAELATALAAADDATLAAIASLNNLSQAGIRSAVGLNGANLDTQLSAIYATVDTEITALQTTATAIKAKTDGLNFTIAGYADVNIQYVNDVQVNGTGAVGHEWGP